MSAPREFEGKAAGSLKNEILRYLMVVKWIMPDFGPTWKWIRDLVEGGQAQTFLVARVDGSDDRHYVLKRLKNVKRRERFDREIQACLTLDHPNVVRIIDYGSDPKDRPFLVTEYCAGGSLVLLC